MRHSLRDEILVVMRYENHKVSNGRGLMQKIEMFRKNIGSNVKVSLSDMGTELRTMVNLGLLDPWQLRTGERALRKVDSIDKLHPINDLYYTLTYSGFQEHLRAVERFVMSSADFQKYLRKKPGQSI